MSLDFAKKSGDFEQKLMVTFGVICFFFLLVVTRLVYLQIIKGSYYSVFSNEHTMKEIRIPATRGVIFDRNKVPLAENRPSFDLALVPQRIKRLDSVKQWLSESIGLDPSIVDEKWKEVKNLPPFFPLVVASDIPYDQAVRVRAKQSIYLGSDAGGLSDVGGIEILARPLRSYPQGMMAAETLGYLAEISKDDLARFQKEEPGRYFLGDLFGTTGLEKYWEHFLKGDDGYEQKVVDAAGREILHEVNADELAFLFGRKEAQHGKNLTLTLDSRLQKVAEDDFKDKAGSLVALDPRNGEILALVSLPSFNPSSLVSNVSASKWNELISDKRKLLLHRALQGTYPPGSTYKIVTAIAGLEESVVRPDERIACPGGLQYGGRFFKCWRKGGHGAVSIHQAIASSCDTYFYQLGLRLGADRIAKYAHLFGLGQKTGVDLDGERAGTIPTTAWKKKVFNQEWQPGENISIAVGQGFDTVTPIENAVMASRVATGLKIIPHLLKSIEGEPEKIWPTPEALPVSAKTFEVVRKGMEDVVGSPEGTAYRIQMKEIRIAGKTGTAQVISEEGKAKVLGKGKGINTGDHAWFIAYAPAENPQIAISVIVEHGGFGASAAAPIARDVIKTFLENQGGNQNP